MTVTPAPPADPVSLKCQCADLWSHPAAQMLIGPSLRPGGLAGTAGLLDRLDLTAGSVLVDVGCGPGESLALARDRGLRPVGVDYSAVLAADASRAAPTVVGDSERLPLRPAAADAVLFECVISAFPDKRAALSEARRVLPVGGRLAMSDMTLAESFPEPLNSALAWVACAAGALDTGGYVTLLGQAGFEVTRVEDRSPDLAEMVARARRRLALFHGAAGIGLVPSLEESIGPDLAQLGRALLGHDDLVDGSKLALSQVADAVDAGVMGYVAMVATAV